MRRAFTLIELMVVASILAILLVMLAPLVQLVRTRGDQAAQANVAAARVKVSIGSRVRVRSANVTGVVVQSRFYRDSTPGYLWQVRVDHGEGSNPRFEVVEAEYDDLVVAVQAEASK